MGSHQTGQPYNPAAKPYAYAAPLNFNLVPSPKFIVSLGVMLKYINALASANCPDAVCVAATLVSF